VRWDSPFVLTVAGTLAIHLIVLTAGDALVVTHPPHPLVPAPHVELVEIELPPELQEPPPPPPAAAAQPAPVEPEVKPAPRPQVARTMPAPARSTAEPPPSKTDVPVPSGGDEVVQMEDIAPGATGVAVARGKPSTGHIGRGGSGGGTGAGSGSGTGDELARPVSIATIKTAARPKRDYQYLGVGKDYPAEATALGIEGDIRVKLIVDDRGTVKSRVLLNKLGHGLDALALQHASELEFEPARDTDDKPVTSVVVWTFHMNLPR